MRFFYAFPSVWTEIGLLVLRVSIGGAAVVQGGRYLADATVSYSGWIGAASVVAGGLLISGFLTPLATILVGISVLGAGLSLLPEPARSLFDSGVSVFLNSCVTLAILLIGPGMFSVDARLFGRREIIIPPSSKLD